MEHPSSLFPERAGGAAAETGVSLVPWPRTCPEKGKGKKKKEISERQKTSTFFYYEPTVTTGGTVGRWACGGYAKLVQNWCSAISAFAGPAHPYRRNRGSVAMWWICKIGAKLVLSLIHI